MEKMIRCTTGIITTIKRRSQGNSTAVMVVRPVKKKEDIACIMLLLVVHSKNTHTYPMVLQIPEERLVGAAG